MATDEPSEQHCETYDAPSEPPEAEADLDGRNAALTDMEDNLDLVGMVAQDTLDDASLVDVDGHEAR